jgi:hypothetical protein
MATLATLGFLAVLSLVLFIASASYLSRGAIRRGLFLLVLGTGLGSASALIIYPALVLTKGGTDDGFRVAAMEQLIAERDALRADLVQKTRDNEALSKTSAFFNKLHKERLVRIADEVRNVKDIILGPKSGMAIDRDQTEATLATVVDGASGFDQVLADIKQLKTLRVRSPDEPSQPTLAMLGPARAVDASGTTGVIVEPPKATADKADRAKETATAQSETLAALRKSLDAGMSGLSYRITALGDPELVGGRTGKYYVVELRSPKTGNRFTFDGGKYTFQTSGPTFAASYRAFEGDVLRQLQGQMQFDLFVRGSADGQAYSGGQLETGHHYQRISYFPSIGGGKYLGNQATIDVQPAVKNSDLPNLRGEYLRRVLSELYPSKPAYVLEGQVFKKDSPAARYAELILFVGW